MSTVYPQLANNQCLVATLQHSVCDVASVARALFILYKERAYQRMSGASVDIKQGGLSSKDGENIYIRGLSFLLCFFF